MVDLLSALNSECPLRNAHKFLLADARCRLSASASAIVRADATHGTATVETHLGLLECVPPSDALWREGKGMEALTSLVFGPNPCTSITLAEPSWQRNLAHDSVPEAVRTWFRALAAIYQTMLCVPIDIDGNRYGSFWLFCVSPPTEHRLASVEGFRRLASLVIENTQLRLKAEEAAILQERSRLARDLHDSVTQSLYSLRLVIEAARRLANDGDLLQVQRALDRLDRIGHQALKEMRLLVYQLRPSVLRRVELVRALGQRLETVEKRAGLDTTLVVEGSPRLSPDLDEQLYYVAQEALNNSLKHAAASRVVVGITGDADTLSLVISDDGCGFDPASDQAAGGFGMASMRERVDRLGGELLIHSEKGRGTEVRVLLKLRGSEPKNLEI